MLQVLMQQARALEAQADTIASLCENLMAEAEPAEEPAHGVDMAGRPIKVS